MSKPGTKNARLPAKGKKRENEHSPCLLDRRGALALAGGALGLALSPTALCANARPNIVVILSDNQRWDFMGCAGHPFVKTPHLDRLAKQGVRFENAFVTTSLCSPSRASFLTGQYAHTHGIKNNYTPWTENNTTFFEIIKQAGYDTAFIGKWHMPGNLPRLRGVDQFVTFTLQKGQGRYMDCPLIINGVDTPSKKPYITEELTDYALEFMSRPRKGPFCLYLSHKAVHHRWIPPPELAGMYDDDQPPFPPEYNPLVFMTRGNMYEGLIGPPDQLYRDYARVITAMDQQIGRLLDRIEEMGITSNTMVIFASDNGFFWGEHQLGGTGRWPYEESIRIPFIVKAPGLVPDPGRRADQMILNIDLAPTVLDIAGIPIPADIEGQSLMPVLQSVDAPGREAFLYEYFQDFPFRTPAYTAVRTRSHVYIEFQGRMGTEIYDLSSDPRQINNLAGTEPGRALAAELKPRLERMKKQGP